MADCLMTDLIRQFWVRCEEPQPVFSADELRWATPGRADAIRACGLLAEGAKATWVNCDACDDGHAEDVIWLRNTETGSLSPFIPCPEVGGAPVDPERLRRWAVDLDLAARLMRQALGLVGQFAPLVPGRVWSLGRRHLAGRFRDFFFVCGAARPDARSLWERCRHIEDAPASVVLVPTRPPTSDIWRAKRATVFRLSEIAGIAETGLDLDFPYIEDAVPREAHSVPVKSIASFPVPDGATWEDLRITIRDAGILAEAGGSSLEFSIEELGFASAEDRPWQLLCLFARLGGQTPARSTVVSDRDAITLRKQVSNLRQRLATIFPIAGEPIRSAHGTGAYRCIFRIGLDRRDGFPSPPERWDDCRFTELKDGRISISVKSKEVLAARTVSEETLRRTAIEAAQRDALRSEEYDLRVLGLADDAGNPTAEGRVLLELLRNGGKLNRRGDDKDLLRLAQRLRTWMGIDGDPFQFSPSRRLWSAVFECQSHRPVAP
jgi:hypothetical protein